MKSCDNYSIQEMPESTGAGWFSKFTMNNNITSIPTCIFDDIIGRIS